jgi:hypothetical protein
VEEGGVEHGDDMVTREHEEIRLTVAVVEV